ncbi:hypothetical protein E0Z10_g2397 [Xylaria hypoxylon]|uniref:Uncharacterized protein n=1 Tax=Xylaria hypoxylon TaxID=37992 RepID=A0A4Z0YQ35_9PEZI|nr:hypothetical protein E0Z10_g2397 [Xylaria hypoxylon]
MANENQDPFTLRRNLANQYKAIEGETLASLFPPGTDLQSWSKMTVLRGVTNEHTNLGDQVRSDAAKGLIQAVALRKQAMPLWPVGTVAEERHWEWIDILERITAVLKTTTEPDDAAARNEIVETTPAAVAEDEKPWTNLDLDIYLEQMAHWRQTLADVWKMAMDDPKQLSVADICKEMELCNEDWYEQTGSYKRKTLEYMEQRDPNGIGGAICEIHRSVKEKRFDYIENELKKMELDAGHLEPVFAHDPQATTMYANIAKRVHAMVEYVRKQDTVPSIAIAFTWADYSNIMMNIGVFLLPVLKGVAILCDANMILRRWQNVPAATDAEQFCNQFKDFLYPNGNRPTTEAGWKSVIDVWQAEMDRINDPLQYYQVMMEMTQLLTNYNTVDRYGKSWIRIAIIEDNLTLKRKDFQMTKGTDQWWQAIKKRATDELQDPSIVEMYAKVQKVYPPEDLVEMYDKLRTYNWTRDRAAVEALLSGFQVSRSWFDDVLLFI